MGQKNGISRPRLKIHILRCTHAYTRHARTADVDRGVTNRWMRVHLRILPHPVQTPVNKPIALYVPKMKTFHKKVMRAFFVSDDTILDFFFGTTQRTSRRTHV